MNFDFDTIVDRRGSDSGKWLHYGNDVLPMWVADMDFASPQPILDAVHARVDHGVFGYGRPPYELRETLAERMAVRQNWVISPENVSFLPGLVCGLNLLCRAIGDSGDGVLVNTPVYMPFLSAPINQDRELHEAELARVNVNDNGHERIYYEIDFDALEAAIQPHTRLFILCNPHNPVGRVYTRKELETIADLCIKHDLVLCSDEIHCDLTLGDSKHISIASLAPEIADRTVTLIAPSKTFNIPGLGCSAAIVQNPELRAKLDKAAAGIVPHVNLLGYQAGLAAYTHCDEWHSALLKYLTANRDFMVDFIDNDLPDLRVTRPEGTYLGWIDCSNAGIDGSAQEFFVKDAKVAFNSGPAFGKGGENFVRLNFGCPRSTLAEGLQRMKATLKSA